MLKKIFINLKQFIETEAKDKISIIFNLIGICTAVFSFFMIFNNNYYEFTKFIICVISIFIGIAVIIVLVYSRYNYKRVKDKIIFLLNNIQMFIVALIFFIYVYNFNADDIFVNTLITILIPLTAGWIARFIFGNILVSFMGKLK